MKSAYQRQRHEDSLNKSTLVLLIVLAFSPLQAQNAVEGFLFKTQIDYESARIRLTDALGKAFYVESLSAEGTTQEQLVEKAIDRTLDKVKNKQIAELEIRKKQICQVSNGVFKSPLIEFEMEDVRKEIFEKVLIEFKKIGFCKSLDYF